jgi:hypothetical protein
LIHSAHEGSHAIEQAMMQDYGVLGLGEVFDKSLWQNFAQQRRIQAAFAQGDKTTVQRMLRHREIDAVGTTKQSGRLGNVLRFNCGKGRVMGANVRTLQHVSYSHPRVAVFILVRTDLMRHALSLAKEVVQECLHPQFGACKEASERKRISLPDLRKNIETHLLKIWRDKARAAVAVVRGEHLGSSYGSDCDRLRFVTYEAFLDSPKEVTAGMWAHIKRVSGGLAKKGETPASRLAVHRVHDSQISSFIENVREVYDMFQFAHLPTFADILEQEGFFKLCPLAKEKGGGLRMQAMRNGGRNEAFAAEPAV